MGSSNYLERQMYFSRANHWVRHPFSQLNHNASLYTSHVRPQLKSKCSITYSWTISGMKKLDKAQRPASDTLIEYRG